MQTPRFATAVLCLSTGCFAQPLTLERHAATWLGGARSVRLAANKSGIRLSDPRSASATDPVVTAIKTFGGSGSSSATVIATDAQGDLYVAGQSSSFNFPISSNAFERQFNAPLRVLSNSGKTVGLINVSSETSVGIVSGTPDGETLYASTADGILVSGDHGATWRATAPLPTFNDGTLSTDVNVISLDPLDPATLRIATDRGLLGSDSGGQNGWGASETGLPVSNSGFVSLSNVFYHPTNPLIVYCTSNSPSFLFASSDAGNTWQQLNPTFPGEPAPPTDPFPPIAATLSADGNTLYVINGNGNLFSSTDSGKTWVKLKSGFFDPSSIKIDPASPSTIYVLDQLAFHKSTDGGHTFSKISTPTQINAFALDSSGVLYISSFYLVYVSADGGKTFAPLPKLTSYSINGLSTVGGKIYVGSTILPVPFVAKLDPTGSKVLYATFLGGSFVDGISGIAVDSHGNAVVIGATSSPDFPFTKPPSAVPGFISSTGFIAKLSADGSHLLFALPLGGSKGANIQAVALDSSDAIYVTGTTVSPDFPTTAHAFQSARPSATCPRTPFSPVFPIDFGNNAFAMKLSADGSTIEYSTLLTGSCGSYARSITVDSSGNATVGGDTVSPDFPVTKGTFQPAFPGSTATALPPSVLSAGFVSTLSPAGDKLIGGTFLGGGFSTSAAGLTLDAAGNVYVTGSTQGFTPGATPGAFQTKFIDRCTPTISIGPSVPYTGTSDAFILKLDPKLSTAQFLSYLGGSCGDTGSNIALDTSGNVWVTGSSGSPDFPLKAPFQEGSGSFVAELSPDASQLLFSSFSQGSALAITPSAVNLAGTSGNMASITEINPAAAPPVEIDSITPIVAFPPAIIDPFAPSVAPGLLIQINGRNLGPATKASGHLDASGRLPFVLAGTIVFFGNIPAPLVSVQSNAILCYVPFEVTTEAQVMVSFDGQQSNTVGIGVVSSAPQVLTIVNQDGTVNSAGHPARLGSVISLYVSGLGQTNPPSADGLTNVAPLPVPLVPVIIIMQGPVNPIEVVPQFVGAAPGMIAGITQINVPLPTGIAISNGTAQISANFFEAPVYVTQ